MIELTDPRWSELEGNYGNGARVAELIAQAESGAPIDEWYEDLFQGLCHQYTVSESAYAAAPHLVKIAAAPGAPRVALLILLGSCYSNANSRVPTDLENEWQGSARKAIPLLAEILAEPYSDECELRYLLSCMAAFNGQYSLARAIESLDVDTKGVE
jgi:hypothetical protein